MPVVVEKLGVDAAATPVSLPPTLLHDAAAIPVNITVEDEKMYS